MWPPGLFYRGTRWSLGAWCELRRDFRNFQLDRVRELELLGDSYPVESGWTVGDLMRHHEGGARQRRDGPGSAE